MPMTRTIEITIGTDRQLLVPVSAKDLLTGITSRQDLTGAFIYFRALRSDGTTELAAKDNDPAALNVGIVVLDQVPPLTTRGQFTVDLDNVDFTDDDPLTGGLYSILVRFDPTGADLRYEVGRGGLELLGELVVVP